MQIHFSFLFVILCLTTFSQDSTDLYKEDLFVGKHISFSVTPHLVQKAKVANEYGPYRITTSYMEGIEAGFNYHYNMTNALSLIVGLHGGASARNYNLLIPGKDFPPANQYDFIENGALTRTFDFYLSAPLFFEVRWRARKNNFYNTFAGINVRFYPDEFSESSTSYIQDENNQWIPVFSMELEVGNHFKPWIDYNMGGGYNVVLKNKNIVRANLIANISNTGLAKGTYKIEVSGKPISGGDYLSGLSYVGVLFSYILTGTNKRLRKINDSRYKN